MPDCSKRLADLSLSDTVTCFFDADIWKQIGANGHRMWGDFTTTTNGQWFDIILGFGILLPAELAVFICPFLFISRLAKRYSSDWTFQLNGKEERRKRYWAFYMFFAASISYLVGPHDTFMIALAMCEALCGVVMLCVPNAWWGRPYFVAKTTAYNG